MDHLPTTEVLNQHVEPELTQEESFRVLEALNTIRVGGLGGTEPVIIDTSSFIGKQVENANLFVVKISQSCFKSLALSPPSPPPVFFGPQLDIKGAYFKVTFIDLDH